MPGFLNSRHVLGRYSAPVPPTTAWVPYILLRGETSRISIPPNSYWYRLFAVKGPIGTPSETVTAVVTHSTMGILVSGTFTINASGVGAVYFFGGTTPAQLIQLDPGVLSATLSFVSGDTSHDIGVGLAVFGDNVSTASYMDEYDFTYDN